MEMETRLFLRLIEISDRTFIGQKLFKLLWQFSFPKNDIDVSGICPDQVEGAELWDYDEAGFVEINGRTVLLDKSVDLQGLVRNYKYCFRHLLSQSVFPLLRAT